MNDFAGKVWGSYENGGSKADLDGANTVLPPILTTRQFMDTFTCPDYIVDGIIQRGRLYALTSPTGHGKTAVALYLASMVGAGRNVGAIEVTQGRVLFLAGENPDDLCGRVHAACEAYGIGPDDLNIDVMPGNFPVSAEAAETLRQKIDATGNTYALIFFDSAAAFFPGDDENHNVQAGAYARNLRVLTGCNGSPAVVALAHPTKNPDRENLLPRGGGAFLAELDGNLTLWADGARATTTLHWQGKLRGADFAPACFALTTVTLAGKADLKGRPFLSVVATLQTADQAETAMKRSVSDENTVLEWLRRHPGIAIRTIAENCHWVSEAGVPNKAKVHRMLKSLAHNKLVRNWRGKWVITDLGNAELKGPEQ
jgi:hypothetical protein